MFYDIPQYIIFFFFFTIFLDKLLEFEGIKKLTSLSFESICTLTLSMLIEPQNHTAQLKTKILWNVLVDPLAKCL